MALRRAIRSIIVLSFPAHDAGFRKRSSRREVPGRAGSERGMRVSASVNHDRRELGAIIDSQGPARWRARSFALPVLRLNVLRLNVHELASKP